MILFEIAEAVLDAEAKIGELTSKMETAKGFASTIKDSGVPNVTKQKQLEQIGITEKQKQRFETLARHPETVERAKEDARAEGRIVTRQDVFHDISATQYPTRRQKAELALKLKPVIAEKAKENQANHTEQGYQKSDKPVTTAKELAKAAGVSHDTIHKVEKIQKEAPEETKGSGTMIEKSRLRVSIRSYRAHRNAVGYFCIPHREAPA